MSDVSAHDPIGKAIVYLMFGIAGGTGLDVCGKWLLADYSLTQFILVRSLFGLGILLLLAPWFGGLKSLRTRRWRWHALRTVLAVGTMYGFFYGLSQIPLVDALTIGFTAPLMATALARPFLGEHVGWRRWTAVCIGFVGMLIVLRPGSGVVAWPALALLTAAFLYATLALISRKIGDTENSYLMSIYVLVGPLLAGAMLIPGRWTPPTPGDWGVFALAGLCSAVAWLGLVGGYRRASPALLAPLEYTALVWGAIAGFAIWNEIPDRWTLLGGAIIVGSGLWVAYRELGQRALANRFIRVSTSSSATAAPSEPEH